MLQPANDPFKNESLQLQSSIRLNNLLKIYNKTKVTWQWYFCFSYDNRRLATIAAAVQVRHGSAVRRRPDKLARPRRELRGAGAVRRRRLYRRRRPPHLRGHVLLAARPADEDQHADATQQPSHHCPGWCLFPQPPSPPLPALD